MKQLFGLALIVTMIAGLVGWVVNIAKLIWALSPGLDDAGAIEILRAVGILVWPLGAVLGWF